MKSAKMLWIFCILGYFCGSLAGRTSYHRTTSLDELREIDNYVSTGLPLFDHGFFVNTAHGPVLVKAMEEGTKTNKPKINPAYYSTLPRLIPSGFEGLSISHFNLGSHIPAQTPSIPNEDQQIYNSPEFEHHFNQGHEFSLPNQDIQFAQPGPYSSHQFDQPQHSNSQTDSRQLVQHPRQQFFYQGPQQARIESRQFIQQHPQQYQLRHGPIQSQQAQDTVQVNNFLSNGDNDVPTSYQSMVIAHESSNANPQSRYLQRNPTVEQALSFEEELPENLRNPFYKNEALASALARESLPVEGETVVREWDTTKIQKLKIRNLLRDAGFLR